VATANAVTELGSNEMQRICIVAGKLQGIGGPASFQRKLTMGLEQRGIEVTYDLDDEPCDAVLIINGTRHITRLWRCKRKGIRIVLRLGAINWLHRYLKVGLRGYLMAEIRNLNMRLIRSFITDHTVYQSRFVKELWERRYGVLGKPSAIIYNGVDLVQFNPEGPRYQSHADVCIISVEGSQGADPFDIAIQLGLGLEERGKKVELLIFGKPLNNARSRFAQYPLAKFMGVVPNSELPYFYRGATFYVSTDILTAACPNSVIEALACGTPVLGYRASVLPEMLDGLAGRCVETQGDPWKGEPPGNDEGMVNAALELIDRENDFRYNARKLAEERYGLEKMVDMYVEVLRA
jgi:glycosyltransferase involved in cell wall biosynthesis